MYIHAFVMQKSIGKLIRGLRKVGIAITALLLWEPIATASSGVTCWPANDTTWDTTYWNTTASDTTVTQPCPGGADAVSGFASRYCSINGEWGPTNVSLCETNMLTSLSMQITVTDNVTEGLMILNSLVDETQPGNDSMLPLDIGKSIDILSGLLRLLNNRLRNGIEVLNTVGILDVTNNLLNVSNTPGWHVLQVLDPNRGCQRLMKTSESYGLYLASAVNTNQNITLSRSLIGLHASKMQVAKDQADIIFPNKNDTVFENATFSATDATVIIPGSLLLERGKESTMTVPVVNMIIKNINMFLSTNNLSNSSLQQVDSLVLSTQVGAEDGGFDSVVLKSTPAVITFRVNNYTAKHLCVFWSFSSSSWSSEGMLPPTSNGSIVQCYSTHLTSFAVLLAVSESFPPDSKPLIVVSYIGCGISMASLLATIIFFLTLKNRLLDKLHNFIHLNLAIALFLAFLVFVSGIETAKHNAAACKAVAALLQYFWLSAFCWMMCEGVMLYLMLVVVFSTLKDKWWFFLLLGWALPLVFVVTGLAVRSEYYDVRSKDDIHIISYCWMSTEQGTIWAFVVPVILIMLINIAFLITVMLVIYKKQRTKHNKISVENKYVIISLTKALILILPLLGCTWIFGLLSVNQYTLVFTWLFTILNSLQGFFIFIFYVLRHEKVWVRILKTYEIWFSVNFAKDVPKAPLSARSESRVTIGTLVHADSKSSGMLKLTTDIPSDGAPDKTEVQPVVPAMVRTHSVDSISSRKIYIQPTDNKVSAKIHVQPLDNRVPGQNADVHSVSTELAQSLDTKIPEKSSTLEYHLKFLDGDIPEENRVDSTVSVLLFK